MSIMNRRSFMGLFPAGIAAAAGSGSITFPNGLNTGRSMQGSGTAELRGITWGKNRGYVPLAATAERYRIMHGITINWERPYDFAHGDLEELSKIYDILMIDHPHVGSAARHGYLVPLNDYLPEEYLNDQAENSVGKSHESYRYSGIQWGLATDAATPVGIYRPDILDEKGLSVPKTWQELIELTERGLAVFPCDPTSVLMNFFMLCDTRGAPPCLADTRVVDEETGVWALRRLRELAVLMPDAVYSLGTTSTHERMTVKDDIAYCPFTYPYCNYSRRGFARKPLLFTNLVNIDNFGILHSTLGGAGLAVSVHSKYREIAVDYIQFTTSPHIQRTLYCDNGGQPGHRTAWLDETNNRQCGNFFKNTLKSHDMAYLRPRYNGYIYFQKTAGPFLAEYLRQGGNEKNILLEINKIYTNSIRHD